jgi:hypothetical protein
MKTTISPITCQSIWRAAAPLLSLVLVINPVWAQSRPCPFPFCRLSVAPQIEPDAGQWETWVLEQGNQLRLPAPPRRSVTAEEIRVLKQLEPQRDQAALDLISFWNSGAPPYRWNELMVEQVVKYRLNLPRTARVMALLNVALYDATIAAWDSKYHYRRPRPSEFSPSLRPALPTPASPSYPSEDAVVAGAASTVLVHLFPDDAKLFADKAAEAGSGSAARRRALSERCHRRP